MAGAYVHLNDLEQARNYYKQASDWTGLMECDLRYQPKMSRVKKMELLYEAYPNCPDFRRQIWEILGKVEPDRDWDDEWSWDWYRDDEHESVEELGELCDKVLSENTVADRYLKMAENSVKDQNLADAIKVMRIFIDAQICKYDKAYDYCNHFAKVADTLSANELMAYTEVALKPKTEFQRFLNAHSYIEDDYLNELVGTHCLREMRYADAERYLSKVSASYFTRTNVYREEYAIRSTIAGR